MDVQGSASSHGRGWERSRLLALLAGSLLCVSFGAGAVPSFSRQTGVACSGCHVGGYGPQLTAFGRQFKLGGYTLGGAGKSMPLSVMDIESFTHTAKDLPDDAAPHFGPNDNATVQEVSLFLAGALGTHVGAFAQTTYSGIDHHVVLDNVDVRYARPVQLGNQAGMFGISVNNNPGIQDPWNSSAAWRFPYTASELAPEAGVSTLLEGGLAQQVVGATAYAYLGNRYYGELGFYNSLSSTALRAINADDGGSLSGITPYYRFNLAWDALSVGLTGLDAQLHPDRNAGPSDHYRDIGVDASYAHPVGDSVTFGVQASAIHESQDRNATFAAGGAEHPNGHIDSINLDGWCYWAHYGLNLGYFDRRGDHDALRYAPDPVDGSRTGKPDSSGVILQADWTPFGQSDSWKSPWVNFRIGVQYTAYSKFNGASHDYDGFGRDAKDNDTLFVYLWNAF